jgi:hypothetical protein
VGDGVGRWVGLYVGIVEGSNEFEGEGDGLNTGSYVSSMVGDFVGDAVGRGLFASQVLKLITNMQKHTTAAMRRRGDVVLIHRYRQAQATKLPKKNTDQEPTNTNESGGFLGILIFLLKENEDCNDKRVDHL